MELLKQKQTQGRAALEVMDQHLQHRDYFVGERASIADIALYGYTHVADEGGFNLKPFGAVTRWLDRVKNQSDHVTVDQ